MMKTKKEEKKISKQQMKKDLKTNKASDIDLEKDEEATGLSEHPNSKDEQTDTVGPCDSENVDPNLTAEDAASESKPVAPKSSVPKVSSATRRKELIEASNSIERFTALVASQVNHIELICPNSSYVYRLRHIFLLRRNPVLGL